MKKEIVLKIGEFGFTKKTLITIFAIGFITGVVLAVLETEGIINLTELKNIFN